MSVEESPRIRQLNELEALKAIYAEDLKDLRVKQSRNKSNPLNLAISLIPQQGNSGIHEINVKLDLHIICTETYPNSVPKILLENSKGLSSNLLKALQCDLEGKADNLKGEEMIFQLCQYTQEFLHKHNKPCSKSFYDEMLQRQREEEKKVLELKQIEIDRQKEKMYEEIQQRQNTLRISETLLRRQRYNSQNSTEESSDYKKFIEELSCGHKGTSLLSFTNHGGREIQRGQCLKHSTPNHTIFSGLDMKSGEIVIVYEWIMNIRNAHHLTQVLRQISSIEQELNYLITLYHNNLDNYYNMMYTQTDNQITVYILKEFIYGFNCSLYTKGNVNIDLEYLKFIAKGVLEALDYLHRHNVIHKNIKDSCVYVNNKGSIILSNYSIYRRLLDLTNDSYGLTNYGKKTDVYKYGILLLSLFEGSKLSDENIEIPSNLPPDLHDLIKKCLFKEEKDRFTTTQLLGHPFFKAPLSYISPKHNVVEIIPERNISPDIAQINLLNLANSQFSGQSRIKNEFEFLQHLGKGAYGDVIKVRNLLDGGFYAIKRIQLNPKNKQLNKKIIREVKLLSRLNHENVVRYYNSWIESTTIKKEDLDSSSSDKNVPIVVKSEEFTIDDNIEQLAPPIKNVEVSITYDSKSQPAFEDSSDDSTDDDDENDEEGNWRLFNEGSSSSDGIEFEKDTPTESEVKSSYTSTEETEHKDTVRQIDFMYIQMEFCEKSTLRTAIDNKLYKDQDRVWRLFREIVEGLAHIHQQGMIHRDLKPVNIFLDYDDHVKIGDFGLATMNIKPKSSDYILSKSPIANERETVDESQTGLIGTALYVAPELNVGSKAFYNQKVDIYSLGIILFEMCYHPIETGMERIKILTGVRCKDIVFPEDFIEKSNERELYLIKWLLNHDTSKRPTSQELLQSEYVPPPVLEECELRELVRHTLNNPQIKGYRYLIASCFNQHFTPAQDITYDKEVSLPNIVKSLSLYDFVKQIILKIFKQHGGQNVSTPLLMPKSTFYDEVNSCVKLMTHFGGIVSLPHDLRVPFARYVAWNNITFLRRYSIERVYREKKVFGFAPRELYECAFDIVTPSQGNLMADAEILYIVYELIKEIPVIRHKNFQIRLNHSSLLKSILIHFGIRFNHETVYQMILEVNEGKLPKNQIFDYLNNLGLSPNSISTLMDLFNTQFEITKAGSHLQMIVKKKSEAGQLAKQAIQDLRLITENAEAFGVTFDIIICPGIVYNAHQYSGMICQFVCEIKRKHRHSMMEVLAAGGRYDKMIQHYRNIVEHANICTKGIQQSAVGISISIDKIIQAMQRENLEELPNVNVLDAVVCSVGTKQLIKEKTKILRDLWSCGIRCSLIENTNLNEIQEQCVELKVMHIIMLKDTEQGIVRIGSYEKDRFQEKILKSSELVEYMQKLIKSKNENTNEPISPALSKSESRTNNSDKNEQCISIQFVTADKLSSNTKRRYEIQIHSQLENFYKKLNGYITVLALNIESSVIKTIACYLEYESEQQFYKSLTTIYEKHQRHKSYLEDICDKIYDNKIKKTKPSIILFSLIDSSYQIIV